MDALTQAEAKMLRDAPSIKPGKYCNCPAMSHNLGFSCTLDRGHVGCHIAHGSNDVIWHVWARKTNPALHTAIIPTPQPRLSIAVARSDYQALLATVPYT